MNCIFSIPIPILLLMCFVTNTAFASTRANLVCVEFGEDVTVTKCKQYELRVIIDSGKSAGTKGAYGVFSINQETQAMSYWDESNPNGWVRYTPEKLIKPANTFIRTLEKETELILYRGTQEGLCKVSNRNSFVIYAWHVSMPDAELNRVKRYIKRSRIKGQQATNVLNMHMLDLADRNTNVGLVFSQTCN